MYKDKNTGNNGVINYIQLNHPELIPKHKEWSFKISKINKLQRKFLNKINVKYTRNKEHFKTQQNWNEFKKFLVKESEKDYQNYINRINSLNN